MIVPVGQERQADNPGTGPKVTDPQSTQGTPPPGPYVPTGQAAHAAAPGAAE